MSKIIAIDGNDGIGKGTQIRALLKELNIQSPYSIQQIVQPSGDNAVGFLREEVKNNPSYKPFARQLLHTVSHVVDAYSKMDRYGNTFLMDRCHSSTFAYGKSQNLTEFEINLLMRIHRDVYAEIFHDFDVRIIFLDRDRKYVEGDTDEFEKSVKWQEVAKNFRVLASRLQNKDEYLFSPKEKFMLLDVGHYSPEEVTAKILQFAK